MIGRSLIILAVTTLGATAVVADSSKITVHRGSDTHTIEIDTQGNALAPKMRIERVPQGPVETATQTNTRMHMTDVSDLAAQPVAGQMLRLTDESGSGLIACHLAWAVLKPWWVTSRRNPPRVDFGKRNLPRVHSRKPNLGIRCYTKDVRPGR